MLKGGKMTKTIYKYTVAYDDIFVLDLPMGAEVLTVQVQYESPYLWALVNTEEQTEKRYFRLAGTGHPIVYDMGKEYSYINSFQLNNGDLVFHLFEILDGI